MSDNTSADSSWQSHPCKLWTRAINGRGYGHHYLGGKDVLAHREALEQKLGRAILPGLQALHYCDTPACFEPEHLHEGTQAKNQADMSARRRAKNRYGPQRLTQADKAEIRRRHAAGGVLHRELAAEYGVSRQTITGAIRNWPHEYSARRKLAESDVRLIRQRNSAGESQQALAREYGVSQGGISRIVRREIWRWVT